MRRILRIVVISIALLAVVAAALAVWLGLQIHDSLPQLSGEVRIPGLVAQVEVDRDELGIPTIRATNRLDAARALGFVHAQDRFFQMDTLRRTGAGELAELFGASLVPTDRFLRLHRFRLAARGVVDRASASHRALVQAYTDGVNAGLRALRRPPPEYVGLRIQPRPWAPEDTVLVVYAMFFDLQQSNGADERAVAALRKAVPQTAFDFFAPRGTDLDAAIDDTVMPNVPVPPADDLDFRSPPAGAARGSSAHANGSPSAAEEIAGSNSWAVDGRRTGTGAALVANDMHLGLTLPTIWYRARLICPSLDDPNLPVDVSGVTLPGAPLVVVGSNGAVAWSFTNAGLDTGDLLALETASDHPDQYRAPDGWQPIHTTNEAIHVRGEPDRPLQIRTTEWGPLLPQSPTNVQLALRWVAHVAEAANLNLVGFETAATAREALDLAPTCGIPVMNLVVGDRQGHIAWTLCGRLPQREGYDGRVPVSSTNALARWRGLLPAAAYPRVFDPPDGRLWTANNRIAGSPEYLATGPWHVALGARARQIRDGLRAIETAAPADFLRIQLDDRALFLERWQKLMLTTLDSEAARTHTNLARLRPAVVDWGGRAVPESSGYPLVAAFRSEVLARVLEPLASRCRAADPSFRGSVQRGFETEQPVWTILEQRPAHLLNPEFATFDELLAEAAEAVHKRHTTPGQPFAAPRWGVVNRVHIQHPLSRALPWLSRWLDLPPIELPGGNDMPRVQVRDFGASERMAVSPGREHEGYLQLPGGQSGHPLSPYYRAGYEAWANGTAQPFLPGPARHRLACLPGG